MSFSIFKTEVSSSNLAYDNSNLFGGIISIPYSANCTVANTACTNTKTGEYIIFEPQDMIFLSTAIASSVNYVAGPGNSINIGTALTKSGTIVSSILTDSPPNFLASTEGANPVLVNGTTGLYLTANLAGTINSAVFSGFLLVWRRSLL